MAFIICEAPFFVLALTEVSFFSSLAVAFYGFFFFFCLYAVGRGRWCYEIVSWVLVEKNEVVEWWIGKEIEGGVR